MNKNTLLICTAIVVIWLPILYYYWIALPSLEREKFEYQKKLDQEEKDKKAQDEYNKQIAEETRKQNYMDCINDAEYQYDMDLYDVCEASYNFCIESVDSYNALWLTYYPQRSHDECEKHKMKDWQCIIYEQLNEGRETRHKDALAKCEKLYSHDVAPSYPIIAEQPESPEVNNKVRNESVKNYLDRKKGAYDIRKEKSWN